MRKVLFFAYFFLFLSENVVLFAAPKALIVDSSFSFGEVPQGTTVQHDFVISNQGTEPLIIQRTSVACGCTAVMSSTDPIPVGGTATVSVSMDTSNFSGFHEKAVTLYLNDPEKLDTALVLQGTIVPAGVIEPHRIDFGERSQGEELQASVKVTPKQGFTISSVEAFSPWVSVSKPNPDGKISIVIKSTAPSGELRERVFVGLSPSAGGDPLTFNIPITARIFSGVTSKPGVLSFGVIEGSSPLKKIVYLENRQKAAVLPGAISIDSSALTATLKEEKPGFRYALEVSLDPQQQFDDLKAMVVVPFGDQEVRIPVFGIRPPKI